MKKSVLSLAAGLFILTSLASCGGKSDSEQKGNGDANPSAASQVEPLAPGQGPNYRFVNMDTVFLTYNLSVDFTEQMLRLTNNYEADRKKKVNSLSSQEQALQKKYQEIENSRVQLPSEVEAFQKDLESFQNQSAKAQQELYEKQLQLEQAQAENLQTIIDSVQNFVNEYAAARGYDAIFFSSATGYYNPSLDVTKEVVEGLNARYNKVKK